MTTLEAPPKHLDAPDNATQTEFEAHTDRLAPILRALYKRIRLAERTASVDGLDRATLLRVDRDAWGATSE
jgi:hypothetical protein